MRQLIPFLLLILIASAAHAADLGSRFQDTKPRDHILQNPGTPDGRDGGETVNDAIVIPVLPFSDTGNTADNVDDYDVACPYTGSTSPDVVYSYTPIEDLVLSIDLCGSGYDTKVYVLDSSLEMVACNDDFYFSDPECGNYTSAIEQAYVFAGQTWYIVIDGYGGDAGDFQLAIQSFDPSPPCEVECPAGSWNEGEPALGPGYIDSFNSGCGDEMGGFPFTFIEGDCVYNRDFCGTSGWLGGGSRDTDWFTFINAGAGGLVTWTLDAEQETYGFVLGPTDCADVEVLDSMLVGPCNPGELTIQGIPGEEVWVWVGPSQFDPPAGFVGHEYSYFAHFEGVFGCDLATEAVSLDKIKTLYR